MTNSTTDTPRSIGLPGSDLLRTAIDPLLTWLPGWLQDMVWAALVMALLYAVLLWLVRHALPWLSTALVRPTRTAIEFGGVALLLPGYCASTLIRRMGRVPGVMFAYGDLVQSLTRGIHTTAAALLRLPARLRRLSKPGLVLVLVVLVTTWNVTYCNGAGKECVIPTSQWIRSVSRELVPPKPAPKPTRCSKKRQADRSAKCRPRTRSTRARD